MIVLCAYCDNEATTTFTYRDCGSIRYVCDECERKLEYQQELWERTGISVKLEDID